MIYWLYRALAFLIRLLPLKLAYWIGLRICDLFYFLNRRGARAVHEHIRIIFAHQGIIPSRQILAGCTRKTFQAFGKYLADFIRFRKLTEQEVRDSISIQGLENIERIRQEKRGAIFLTAHYGNWELGGSFCLTGHFAQCRCAAVSSPSLERIFHYFRKQRGLKIIRSPMPALASSGAQTWKPWRL